MTDGLSAGAPLAARRIPALRALGVALLLSAAARVALEFLFAVEWAWYDSPLITLIDTAVMLLPAAGAPAAAGLALIRPHHLPRRVGITFAVIRIVQALGLAGALVSGGTGGLLSWTGFYLTCADAVLALAIIVILVRLRPPAPAVFGAPPRMTLPGRLVGVSLALAGAAICFAAFWSLGSIEETNYWSVLAYPWAGRFAPMGFAFALVEILLSLQALALSFGYGAALIASGFGLGHLLSELPPERLIVWAHPHIVGGEREEREAEWRRFRATLGKLFPKPFPETLGEARFFHFDAGFNPIPAAPTPRRWYTPWRWLRPQQSALRNLLIAKGTPPFDPETLARRRRIRRRIVTAVGAVVALIVVALATLIAIEFMRVSRDFAERRWNLLALDLVYAETSTEGTVDANGEWRQTLRTTEQIQSALTAVPLRLEDRLFAEDSWNNAPYGQLAELRPVAEAYVAIFEAARQDPAVEKLLLVRASVIITADLASVEDAEHRLATVEATLAALERFDMLWQTVPPENRTGWTGPERLEKLIPLRRALLLAQQAELKAFIDEPGAWQSAPGDSGPTVTFTDQTFAARAEPLRQAEVEAYTALVQELSGMVN